MTGLFPDESQILTTGTDKIITYWDVIDINEIRTIDGSYDGEINTIAISKTENILSLLVKINKSLFWDYDLASPK